ncbi:MAG: FecR domain-containing protein, partial [Akkermansiaceae bacterium]
FGTVLSAKGEAYVTRGFLEFDIKIEDELQFDDEIETGEDGRVQLSFKSSFISIGPNTCFSISKEEEDGMIITLIDLECGEIRSKILALEEDERYRVDSINGAVEVTGTDFVTGVNPDDDALSVSVLHGGVKVSSEDDSGASNEKTVSTMQALSGVGVQGGAPSAMNEGDATGIKNRLPIPGDSGAKSEVVEAPSISELIPRSFAAVIQSQAPQGQELEGNNDSGNDDGGSGESETEESSSTTETEDNASDDSGADDVVVDDVQVDEVVDEIVDDVTNDQTVDDMKDDIATENIVRRLSAPSFLPPPSTD